MRKIDIVSFVNSENLVSDDAFSITRFIDVKSTEEYFDIALFDKDSILEFKDFKEISINHDIFRVIVVDDSSNANKYKDDADAWISSSSLEKLSSFFVNLKAELSVRKDLFFAKKNLEKAFVGNFVNLDSISLIKDEISQATKKLSVSFENRINELRDIDGSVGAIKLSLKKIEKTNCENDEVQKSLKMAQEVSESLSHSIDELMKHVQILQCEDKIFQLFDGIINVLNDVDTSLQNSNFHIDETRKGELMKKLVKFYYIQEQRDFVSKDKNDDSVESGILTLF
jgi:hypothetical protein